MNQEKFQTYLDQFNNKNYEAAFEYYAPDGEFEIVAFGHKMSTRAELKSFYTFLHTYIKEEINPSFFHNADNFVAMEAIVKVTGIKRLTPEIAEAQGQKIKFPIEVGEIHEISQFIHYHINAEGKIAKVLCALFEPA